MIKVKKSFELSALESIEYAQWIAFAPMVFQATRVLKSKGILSCISKSEPNGLSLESISEKTKVSNYGVRVLLEAGLGIGLVKRDQGVYHLTKTGFFVETDEMTRVNMNFVHDVCYLPMFDLEESIETGKPEGLKVFGDWDTVYEGLSKLAKPIQKSWFEFDHFYSDDAFDKVLPQVFKTKPKVLFDIGGNTGKWALKCLNYDPEVQMVLIDLPGQVNMAKQTIKSAGFEERVSYFETNMLNPKGVLPAGADIIWMSQFLDCFSEDEIVSILRKCHNALEEDGMVCILEPFWDVQKYQASSFALQQTSLYFTTVANGNSQMYDSQVFLDCVKKANFEVVEQINDIGRSQTLLKLIKSKVK